MYNEDLKRRFLDDFKDSKTISSIGEYVFNAMEPHEIKWGGDFCTMSLEAAGQAINGMFGVRAKLLCCACMCSGVWITESLTLVLICSR